MTRSRGMPARSASAGALGAERHDRFDDIVVHGVRVRRTRGQPDVGRDHRRSGRRGDRQILRVHEAADVVAHDRADGVRGLRDRRSPRVDRDRDVEPCAKRLDRGDDAVELLGLAHLVAGARLHAADVEQVGAVDDELLGLPEEVVEPVVATLRRRTSPACVRTTSRATRVVMSKAELPPRSTSTAANLMAVDRSV